MIDADPGDDGDEQRSALRRQARRSRVLRMAYARFRQALRFARVQGETTKLRCSRRRLPPSPAHPNVVVSLTSFPARLQHAWISIETIFRQDHLPDRIVLVLAEDECSRHELPRKLREQQRRGLEILWTPRNTRSFNKLLPTRLAYPDATIITVDDDALYEPWLVSRLIARAERRPGTVIGHRGWTIDCADDGPVPYIDWEEGSPETPAERVFLTGIGGILYPPDLLPVDLLTDADLATTLCPTADDVWFWAVARCANVPSECLGLESFRPCPQQADTPELQTINLGQGQNDVQLFRVIDHFGLTFTST
jgi:hypothetical protein